MIQYQRQSQLRYSNKQFLTSLALGLTLLFGIFSTAASSTSSYLYAQQQQLQNGATTQSSTSTAIGVKITSPARGQQVPVGSLTISGTSKDNTNSDCTVYALWDDLKPYQKVKPTGPSGTDDYSNWTFTYTSAYHLITNGTNQLTAKISCLASSPSSFTTTAGSSSSNLTKWYSINVTGMPINQTSNTAPITASNNITNTTVGPPLSPDLLLPLPVPSTTVDSDSNSEGHNTGGSSGGGSSSNSGGGGRIDDNNKELSISIKVDKDPIVRGNDQTVTVTVSDAKSDDKIDGASVKGSVKYASGKTHKDFHGPTNNGQYAYTFPIGGYSTPGLFNVEVFVSADGYKSGSEKDHFKVIPASSSNQSSSNKKVVRTTTTPDKHTDKDNPDNNNDTTTTTTTTSDGVDNNIGTNLNPPTNENNDKNVDNGKKDNNKDNDGSKSDNLSTTQTTDDQNKKDADKDKDKDKSKSPIHDGDDNNKKEIKEKEKNKDVKSKIKIKNQKKKIKP
jgi:hypothetical protein